MKTPKRIGKAIAKKFTNWKGSKGAAMEEPRAIQVEEKNQEETVNVVDQATENDTKLCKDINVNSEHFNVCQPTCENDEEVQDVLANAAAQELNTLDNSSSAESPFDSGSGKGNSIDEKSSKRSFQPIVAGVVGTVALVSGIASYIMKMPVVAVVVGIVGLACISFALYDALKPNTKLEKVKSVEQLDVQSALNPT